VVHGQTKNKAQPYALAADVQDPSAQIVRRVAPVILHAASAGRCFVKVAKKVLPIAAVLSAAGKYVVTAFRPTNATRARRSFVKIAKKVLPIAAVLSAAGKYVVTAFQPSNASRARRSFVKIAMEVLPIAAVLSVTRKFVVTAFRPTNAKRAKDSGVNAAVFEEMLNNMVSMVSKRFKVQAGANAQAVSDAEAAMISQTLNAAVNSAIHISVTTVL
jgi:ribosomal protein L34